MNQSNPDRSITLDSLRLAVVCFDNRCRSALAECAMRQDWEGRDFEVQSVGIVATDGLPAHDIARVAALDAGLIGIETHRSRRLNTTMLQNSDLILVMDEQQQRDVLIRMPNFTGRVHLLGKWGTVEIGDPIADPRLTGDNCLALIRACLNDWRRRLEAGGLLAPARPARDEPNPKDQRHAR